MQVDMVFNVVPARGTDQDHFRYSFTKNLPYEFNAIAYVLRAACPYYYIEKFKGLVVARAESGLSPYRYVLDEYHSDVFFTVKIARIARIETHDRTGNIPLDIIDALAGHPYRKMKEQMLCNLSAP